MPDERCETCRFWRTIYADNEAGRRLLDKSRKSGTFSGRCHRYPPTFTFDEQDDPDQFPKTRVDDWCGEYQIAPAPEVNNG